MSALCSDTIIIALMIALEKRFVIGGQNPSGPLFSHPLKSILRECSEFQAARIFGRKKRKKVAIRNNELDSKPCVYSIVRTILFFGDTKVDTNKTPFEYTYISQHFGFIIPSSLALRTRQEEEEKEGKKWRKSRSTFCRTILPTPIDRKNNYGRISERERERKKRMNLSRRRQN